MAILATIRLVFAFLLDVSIWSGKEHPKQENQEGKGKCNKIAAASAETVC